MKRIERQLIECMYENFKIAFDFKEREPLDAFDHYAAAHILYKILYKCGTKRCTEREICNYIEKVIDSEIGYEHKFSPKGYIELLTYFKQCFCGKG